MKMTGKLAAVCCVTLLTLTGCKNGAASSPNPSSEDSEKPAQLQVSDYFPITENTRYDYQGKGNEYASYVVYNDYTSENQVQQRIDNGGTVVARVISLSNGKLIQTYSSGEAYHRENELDQTGDEEILLEEPIAKGTAWTLKDGSTRTITNASVPVSTPSGKYDAVEVTTEGTDGKTTQYYAKDVGLIQTVYDAGESQISSSLRSVEKDVPLTQTIRFFYPNVDQDKIYYEDREIPFRTNDVTKDVIAASYREVPSGVVSVFSQDTVINSLTLRGDGKVALDLNQAFCTEMNAGSGYEAMILHCIANTFGYYYQTDKVVLTIDGQPYSSGHFEFQEGEYLQADLINAVQLSCRSIAPIQWVRQDYAGRI